MSECGKQHAMIRIGPERLTAYQQWYGTWWQCTKCHQVAVIPAEKIPESVQAGRHRAG